MQIKDININERPREKLFNHGVERLSDAELLAVIMGSGTKDKSALELSHDLINLGNGNLDQLAGKSKKEFSSIKGVGKVKALCLEAIFELGKRRKSALMNKLVIRSSKDIYDHVYPQMIGVKCEEFWLINLNKGNRIISKRKISSGGVSATIVDVKVVLKYAIEELASAVIVFHNHPSGNCVPSKADHLVTEKLQKALSYCDIKLLDHIIVCPSSYYSFSDEDLL